MCLPHAIQLYVHAILSELQNEQLTHVLMRCHHGRKGTMDRITKQNGMRAYWHADTCFTCEVCEEMLVDLICFKFQTNRMLCSRHWSDQHKPRCAACDETIHAKDFTVAEGQNWHVEHFCCEKCDVHLAGKEYVAGMGFNVQRS